MKITDEMVSAAWRVLWAEGVTPPYMARVGDYVPEDATEDERTVGLAALKAADEETNRLNNEVMRRALEAALGDTPNAEGTCTVGPMP